MENKKVLGYILTTIILINTILIGYVPKIKADANTGYVHIEYFDSRTGENVAAIETIPVQFNGSSKQFDVPISGVSGYILSKTTVNGSPYNRDIVTVTVTQSNTIDNPINVKFYYSKNSSVRTVKAIGICKNLNTGKDEIFSEKIQTADISSGSVQVKTEAPNALSTAWSFKGASIGKDGPRIDDKYLMVNVTDSDIEVYYWFEAAALGIGNIRLSLSDNELDENGNIVNASDGNDWMINSRIDRPYENVVGEQEVEVSSPTNASGRDDLEFAFALVEHQRGNPQDALTNYIDKRNEKQFSFKMTTESPYWYVHFYWKKKGTIIPTPSQGEGGKIVFNPNETKWTNEGKLMNGVGSYPVEVEYVGDNPFKEKGTVTYHHSESWTTTSGNPPKTHRHTKKFNHNLSFDVKYYLDHMTVSGDSTANISGTRGTTYIVKEGAYLKLSAEGFWKKPEYKVPGSPDSHDSRTGTKIPPAPDNPRGESGTYKLDWTEPECEFNVPSGIFSTDNKAVRKESIKGVDDGFFGNITLHDNLSGVKKAEYGWTFGQSDSKCKYESLYRCLSGYTENDRGSERIVKEVEKPVGDNVFLHVKIWDMAGNYTYKRFGPFEDPVKLKNFQITDVRDPNWDKVFWKDDKFTQPTGKAYKADQLPLDNTSNPIYKNSSIKKGYAWYFDVTSEYLYRNKDRIVIKPSFYYYDGNNRVPVDVYYQLNNNPFIKFGSKQDTTGINMDTKSGKVSIGGMPQLTLTKDVRIFKGRPYYGGWKDQIQYKDGKEQYWYGKYFIPATSIFVPRGKEPRPENVLKDNYIIVNFQIVGYKNGVETVSSDQIFTYVPTQWKEEGGPKTNRYEPGDVIVHDNRLSALDDFKTYVTH